MMVEGAQPWRERPALESAPEKMGLCEGTGLLSFFRVGGSPAFGNRLEAGSTADLRSSP